MIGEQLELSQAPQTAREVRLPLSALPRGLVVLTYHGRLPQSLRVMVQKQFKWGIGENFSIGE